MSKDEDSTGITCGTVIAVAISWHANQNILLAIVHGMLSWVYIIWRLVT